jgi:hypothetical protein
MESQIADDRFRGRGPMPDSGQSATFKSERERFDRRRSQFDLLQTVAFLLSRRSEVLRECAYQSVATNK